MSDQPDKCPECGAGVDEILPESSTMHEQIVYSCGRYFVPANGDAGYILDDDIECRLRSAARKALVKAISVISNAHEEALRNGLDANSAWDYAYETLMKLAAALEERGMEALEEK